MEQLIFLFTSDFGNTLLRFVLCAFVNWVIIDRLYFRKVHRRDFYFTFMLISVAIFFLVYFMMGMDRGKATMGVGLGLFGIFSIMRYRTDSMPVREMTYLFIIVCLSVVHAMVDVSGLSTLMIAEELGKLAVIDLIVMGFIMLCEQRLSIRSTKLVLYDRIELVKPERYAELKEDLEQRLGIKVLKVEVGGVDFLKDSAVLRVTYDGKGGNDVDGQYNVRKSQWRTMCLLLLVCLLPAGSARAQGDDFGIWTEANVEKKISNRLTLEGGLELRTRDDGFGELDRWSVSAGADYRLTDWLKVSAGYSLLDDHVYKLNSKETKYADYWGVRHRVNVSLTASQQFGRLGVSLRERWQYTYRPEKTVDRYWAYTNERKDRYEDEVADEHTYDGKAKSKWRNRLQLKYKLSKQWRPYVNAESTVGGSGLDKMRYALGTEWRLTKQHVLDLHYMYQHSYKDDDSEGNRHVLGLGYLFKF